MESIERGSTDKPDVSASSTPQSSLGKSSSYRFIGALATDVLVGRNIEQQAIQRAVSAGIGSAFQLVMFVAHGGIGKTRLLREANKQLQPEGQWHDPHVLCLPLIDVADPLLHREVAFLREARRKLDKILPKASDVFARFDTAFEMYQQAREHGEPYPNVQRLIQVVVSTFAADYEALTQQYRVVWLIDTLEQLFGVQPEIEDLLGQVGISEAEIGQTTYSWLMKLIQRQPQNTTLILAGRPTPIRWTQDVGGFNLNSSIFREFTLAPFSPEETNAYFTTLAQQLMAEGYEIIANYLQEMQEDSERPEVMYQLTGGNPIRLALYIDMIANIQEEPEEFQIRLEELRSLNVDQLDALRKRVNHQLLSYIESGIGHPENAVLKYLFVTRRGLNTARLQRIWGADAARCQQVLSHLRRLSFVKSRSKKVFLHDELYTMYAQQLVDFRETEAAEYSIAMEGNRSTYQKISDFLDERITAVTQEINAIRERNKETVMLSEQEREDLRRLRQARPRYIAEKLHYQLYLDPIKGFNDQYYIYAEQAFLGNDSDLDNYLQSEIEQFFFGSNQELHRQQVQLNELEWSLLRINVMEERAVRWIKRLTQFQKLRRAQVFASSLLNQAVSILAKPDVVFPIDTSMRPIPSSMFTHEAHACRCFAEILQGETIMHAVRELDAVIAQIESVLREKRVLPALRNRVLNIVAQCYLYNGYAYATLRSFRMAQKRYEIADAILRRTENEALHAEVQNDLSRALGELGERIKAEGYCQDGLQTRKALGFDYATALSLNTFALINNRNSRPTTARSYAKEALLLFRQLHNARGIVMALVQRAEAKRRSWGLNPSHIRLVLLEEAEELLKEVEDIFDQGAVQEKVRLIGAKIERGSLYRDWAGFLQSPDGDKYFEQAIRYLDEARELAQESNYLTFELDAIVNKAYLFVYYNHLTEAKAVIAQAHTIVPEDYLLTTKRPIKLKPDMNLTIFNQLSKLLALQARIIVPTLETFAEPLTYHILGTTYSQIFSATSWYSGEHQKELHKLLNSSRFMPLSRMTAMADQIIHDYHLRELEQNPDIGPLKAIQVIQELVSTRPEIDYLQPDV